MDKQKEICFCSLGLEAYEIKINRNSRLHLHYRKSENKHYLITMIELKITEMWKDDSIKIEIFYCPICGKKLK